MENHIDNNERNFKLDNKVNALISKYEADDLITTMLGKNTVYKFKNSYLFVFEQQMTSTSISLLAEKTNKLGLSFTIDTSKSISLFIK